MGMEALEPCPECEGKITLYSHCSMTDNYNSFARCGNCKKEFPMPEAWLKSHGVHIYPASIKKAERCWNRRAIAMRSDKQNGGAK
jgi:uncharacterized protein with PIN domain